MRSTKWPPWYDKYEVLVNALCIHLAVLAGTHQYWPSITTITVAVAAF
jgi:hypothetical protein